MPEPALESQPEESAKLDEVQTDHREAHIGGKPAQIIFEAETRGQVLSGYEDLTVWQTMKAFPMPTFYCVIPSIAAAADGYQVCPVVGAVTLTASYRAEPLRGWYQRLDHCSKRLHQAVRDDRNRQRATSPGGQCRHRHFDDSSCGSFSWTHVYRIVSSEVELEASRLMYW